MADLNLYTVREFFPALAGEWTFFDNAGGSQVLQPVADRIRDFMLSTSVQHGASYAVSQQSMKRVAEASQAMATWVNASSSEEIVMGGSTTLLLRLLSISMGKYLQAGDEIIVSNTDHEANVSPWMDLQALGIKVHIWKCRPDTFELEISDLEALMNERTKLVTLTHSSNVLGTINPIKEIAAFVQSKGAMICVDGVAYAPHGLVDVQELGVDFYVFSCYKVYGPHYALLFGKREHLVKLPGLNHYFIQEDDLPYKFQPGNVNFELCYGMLGVMDYIDQLYTLHFGNSDASLRDRMEAVYELWGKHEEKLSARLLEFLKTKPKVRIIGKESPDRTVRVPTISFVVQEKQSDEIVGAVDQHKIGIRFGDFYAKKLIEDTGIASQNGVVRVSMVHYNSLEEVDRLINALNPLLD